MPEIGPLELLVVAVVALIVFGPEKLPEMARNVGQFASDLRRMATEVRTEIHDAFDEDAHEDDEDFVDESPPEETGGDGGAAQPREGRALDTQKSESEQI
jgi:Tat protein translocase TatB subunit